MLDTELNYPVVQFRAVAYKYHSTREAYGLDSNDRTLYPPNSEARMADFTARRGNDKRRADQSGPGSSKKARDSRWGSGSSTTYGNRRSNLIVSLNTMKSSAKTSDKNQLLAEVGHVDLAVHELETANWWSSGLTSIVCAASIVVAAYFSYL